MQSNYKRLGDYIREVNIRNRDLVDFPLLGVSIKKVLMPSIANIIGTDMSTYKLIKKNQFAYGPVTSRNGEKISIAILEKHENALLSQAYTVFEVKNENELLPDYLMMWFKRPEFDRYARFMSHGSAREIFSWAEMCDTLLPIPSPAKQLEIVKEYHVIQNRINLSNQLIIKLEQAAQAIYKHWFIDFEFPDGNGLPYKSSGGEMVESDLGMMPIDWRIDKLSNYTSYIGRGITPKYSDKGGMIVINQKCIRSNSLDLNFSRLHNLSLKKVSDEKILKDCDILVNSTGTGTLGRVALVKAIDNKMTVDTHVTIVRAKPELAALYLWFNLSSRTTEIELLAEGSTGQTELSRDNLGYMNIILPANKIQLKFSVLMQSVVKIVHLYEKENAILKQLNNILFLKMTKVVAEEEFV